MTSRAKSRRSKRPVEALDWRQLADAPALRGLAEVLSPLEPVSPPATSPAVVSPTGGVKATAVVSPTLSVCVPPTEAATPFFDVSSSEGEIPTVGESPVQVKNDGTGDTPTVGDSPAVVTKSLSATEEEQPSVADTHRESESPSAAGLRQGTAGTSSEGVWVTKGDWSTVGETPAVVETPGVYEKGRGWWVTSAGVRFEGKRVQRVVVAEHSMSLGEERVYQSLWNASGREGVIAEGPQSKVFTLGYDRIARLVRLNEKSVRLLMPKLIAKRILEVIAAEHSAEQIGRTYRIFSGEEILARQRAADLTAVVKNGRAVEFVQPQLLGTP